jgi:hypothetical protein
MLGRTMVGERLADLRSVMRYLRTRPEINATRIGSMGDSFADVNLPGSDLHVPLGVVKEGLRLPNPWEEF